jgi:hypothetical protein
MPRYTYRCVECDKIWIAQHLISEKPQTCNEISECTGSSTLEKILSIPTKLSTTRSSERKPGEIVKKYIEETRQDLENEKTRLKRENGRE